MVFSCFAVYVLATNTRVVPYLYRRVWPPVFSKYTTTIIIIMGEHWVKKCIYSSQFLLEAQYKKKCCYLPQQLRSLDLNNNNNNNSYYFIWRVSKLITNANTILISEINEFLVFFSIKCEIQCSLIPWVACSRLLMHSVSYETKLYYHLT